MCPHAIFVSVNCLYGKFLSVCVWVWVCEREGIGKVLKTFFVLHRDVPCNAFTPSPMFHVENQQLPLMVISSEFVHSW